MDTINFEDLNNKIESLVPISQLLDKDFAAFDNVCGSYASVADDYSLMDMKNDDKPRTPDSNKNSLDIGDPIDDQNTENGWSDSSEDMRNFFPATRKDFIELAGEVKRVTRLDFEDYNRKRHLESFAKSMDLWNNFDNRDAFKNNQFTFTQLNFDRYTDVFLNVDSSKLSTLDKFISELFENYENDMENGDLDLLMSKLRRKYHISPSKRDIFERLELLQNISTALNIINEDDVPILDKIDETDSFGNKTLMGSENSTYPSHIIKVDSKMKHLLRNKATRSNSGVVVITVLTSPGSFSCSEDCHYCPNEPGQPRSYLSTEPAVLRANQNSFDAVKQFYDRANTLYKNGHVIDKIEIIVLGGTWSGYPRKYQFDFIRDIFYAANIYPKPIESARKRGTLECEQKLNETATCRIIGLTLETRPDRITPHEIETLRILGCTRVQLGIQHTNDSVLEYVNRGHTIHDSINAIYLLKENCFKVDIHIMPDLPSSNVQMDFEMFDLILSSDLLQADQWKIYPCEVTPFTEIERWHKEGKYIPYFDIDHTLLLNLLMSVKRAVHPWIRLNRVIRDIPNPSIIAGTNITNMRQLILKEMKTRNVFCHCIRCREVKGSAITDNIKLVVRQYRTKGGTEYFLSYESHDEMLIYGFLRLRLRDESDFNPKVTAFKCLENCALVRELHVYGIVVVHGKTSEEKTPSQHRGIGASLLLTAEIIAMFKGFNKMAVIAGIGTREYYAKHGYILEDTYMIKYLTPNIVSEAYNKNIDSDKPVKVPDTIKVQEIDLGYSSILLNHQLPQKNNSKKKARVVPDYTSYIPPVEPDFKRFDIHVNTLLSYAKSQARKEDTNAEEDKSCNCCRALSK
ncbi:histone acetyltransferase, ELP3 family member protein [Theileria equi strain WA]|uniref:tRNA carboxymethyluridine synthase n=1 Tax=Theileria equi strain WA TaxID=1537102 RepID=L0AVW1_THEEQ|nr:histone acetyltransferase, ELP3 family member protein [Theileria equi strain WA]AFZ79029.1 histone acetyltransferase, ELP3 family member protein [Theileria equi strain WA]|eukprot:XP_004828695.1 histone acetyltransferase, ELP3 family member protein [Theileria equi strain WA]